jgi:predicted short-subunit dehydrogenase-like oxidoreductase (DUF2520 family)
MAAARQLARLMGMRPFHLAGLSHAAYHAAASLLAGGTAALLDCARDMLARAGIPRERALTLLLPLLGSVLENVSTLGLPAALTGPARRGDRQALERQLALVRAAVPSQVRLHEELVRIALRMAEEARGDE